MSTDVVQMVCDALENDGRVTSQHVHVSVNDGVIVLDGEVDSLEEYGIVQEIVETATGATVENNLSIEGEVDTGPCCRQM